METHNTPRPDAATDERLRYLDRLRDSGKTNMFGAGPYLMKQYGLSRLEAAAVLAHWMATYAERHESPARAD